MDKETEARGKVCGSGGGHMGPHWPGTAVGQLHCNLPSPAGAQYWVYNGEKPVLGPAPISELGLLGSPIQAALAWGPEKNKIYFFGGGDYWRFHLSTGRVDSPVPRRATDWRGVPPEIDAAFRDADGALGWSGWLVPVVPELHLPRSSWLGISSSSQVLSPGLSPSTLFLAPGQCSAPMLQMGS